MEKGRKAAMLRAAVSLPLSVVSGMRCGRNRCKRGLFPVARIHPDGDGAVIDEFHLHVGPEDARSDRSAEELREPLRKDAVERQARRADVRRAIALLRGGHQRELADGQDFASDLPNVEIHHPLRVVEDTYNRTIQMYRV